jgi:hypothetical protein
MGIEKVIAMVRRLIAVSAALVLVTMTACSGESNDASTSTAATTSVVEQSSSSEVSPFPAGEPLDLLVLTDSSGWGVADRYAPLAAEALDREVRALDLAGLGDHSIKNLLEMIQTSRADEVAESEIIVVYGYPGGLEYELPLPNILACLEAVDAVDYPEEYEGDWSPGEEWEEIPVVPTVEDWSPFRAVLDQVYDEIWRLRAGQPTILRTYEVYNGFGVAAWTELGIHEECIANYEVLGQVVREAAEANGAGFVSLLDAFNGPNQDEDPRAKGLIGDDGFHANENGQDLAVETLAAIGFEVSEPPR